LQAPARMTIDTNGIITWTTHEYQNGNSYPVTLKVSNSYGYTIKSFTASASSTALTDTGIVEYKTETAGNRIRFWQKNQGSIGYRASELYFGMEYPSGSNYSLVYAGGLWFGGLKKGISGNPDTVTIGNCEFTETEFQPGRILNNGPFGTLISENYHQNQTFFALPENYTNWPESAPHTTLGQPLQLSGKDTWTVFNDLDTSLLDDYYALSPGLGVEIQRQTFQFTHYPFNHAVLVRYRILNKSNKQYDSCYVGFFNDPDVGANSSEDLLTVNPGLSLMTVFNDTVNNLDPFHSACGILIMQGPLASGTVTDTANKIMIGTQGFTRVQQPSYKILQATAADNGLKTFGPFRLWGDLSRYWFMKGLDGLGNVKPGGAFSLSTNGAQDQQVIFSTGPFNFAAGDTQEVWMAYIGGMGVDNASAVDTVRYYAQWILNDFKNNQIYKFDHSAPALNINALSTQAVNRVRFLAHTDEPLKSFLLKANSDTLTVYGYNNGYYYADYNIKKTGNLTINLTGTDIAGNTGMITRIYQVSPLNKPAPHGNYSFHAKGDGYLLTTTADITSIPDKCMRIGEPVDWAATPSANLTVDYTYSNVDLERIQERYTDFNISNLGLYAWNGSTWEPIESSISSNQISGIAKGSALAVFYNPEANSRPQRFALEQNYPNPFNPNTVIRYQIPEMKKVTLKIYNILGQEIRTLVNTKQAAGVHSVVWDGKDQYGHAVSTGVYLYRMQAGDFVMTKKMVLVK